MTRLNVWITGVLVAVSGFMCAAIAQTRATEMGQTASVLPSGLGDAIDRDVARVRDATDKFKTTDAAEAAARADVQFLCVGTPQEPGKNSADLSYAFAAIDSLAPYIKQGALLVGKSTVPVGTTRVLQERFLAAQPHRTDVMFAWNPEFLREGFQANITSVRCG